ARSDNDVCRMGADGSIQLCCGPYATLTHGPILQDTAAIVGTTGTSATSSRLYAIPDGATCAPIGSGTLADFASTSPAIDANGIQGVTGPTVAADGTAVLATDDRRLIALNPDTSLRWNVPLPDQATAPPSHGAGNLLYVGTLSGDILAINVSDGSTVWTYNAG